MSQKSSFPQAAKSVSQVLMSDTLTPANCGRVGDRRDSWRGVSKKTIDTCISVCRTVIRHYGLVKMTWMPLAPEWESLLSGVNCPYQRMSLKRLLSLFTSEGVTPGTVTPDAVPQFLAAVQRDARIGNAPLYVRRSLREWNKLRVRHPEIWPQVRLDMPLVRRIWGKPWAYFPAALERAVDAFLAPTTNTVATLFRIRARPQLKPSTIKTQKNSLRCVACALHYDGVPLEELNNLRALCTPERYKRAIAALAARAGGVTRRVEETALVLSKVAKYGEVLDKAEIEAVVKLQAEVSVHACEMKKLRVDRDQALLDRLDDPRLVDALLNLPSQTLRRALAAGKTCRTAYAVQRAVMLTLWFYAPLRNINFLGLTVNYFKWVAMGDGRYLAIQVPGNEVKNGQPLEHFLDEETAQLLDLYIRAFLPLIVKTPTQFLFPGPSGAPKTQQSLGTQMRNYLRRELKIEGFHPHVMRKIVPKLTLDQDPEAMEVARRAGGWKGDATLRRAYMHHRNRTSQERYLELLKTRRQQANRRLTDKPASKRGRRKKKAR